ncbi:NAD(P)H-dependent oxidoreductase [Kangiella sp. TOML190]|uniref:NAD(P)H-dependent oxidoreductase n=1 Tax=Kangiella sp. TOML190 TaxID=2931351 RepID=UPI002041CC02|nr:NAD(P)H-dependent oxidoreductase [Kangiella sp. TOML190]
MANRVLINFAHPRFEASNANKLMVSAVKELEGVTFNDLYERYPDFLIDVEREQQLLLEHDIIVFHHPLYWYSAPALLKEWQDLVLEAGFAYGTDGYQLQHKYWLNAMTLGGTFESYDESGYNHFPLELLMKPFEQTAVFCGMNYLKPFAVYDVLRISKEKMIDAAESYRKHLIQLQNHLDLVTGEFR